MRREFFPMKVWTCKLMPHLWDSPLPSNSSWGDVGGKHIMCETDARLCCWNLGLLQNITLKATGPVHDKPSPCPPHKLWLVSVSFLTFLEMSQLPVHLYWLFNKLWVVLYVYRKIKVHKIATSIPSHFHSSTLIQTQKYSQKILIPAIAFLSYCWWPWKIEIWDNTVYTTV